MRGRVFYPAIIITFGHLISGTGESECSYSLGVRSALLCSALGCTYMTYGHYYVRIPSSDYYGGVGQESSSINQVTRERERERDLGSACWFTLWTAFTPSAPHSLPPSSFHPPLSWPLLIIIPRVFIALASSLIAIIFDIDPSSRNSFDTISSVINRRHRSHPYLTHLTIRPRSRGLDWH